MGVHNLKVPVPLEIRGIWCCGWGISSWVAQAPRGPERAFCATVERQQVEEGELTGRGKALGWEAKEGETKYDCIMMGMLMVGIL